MHGAKYTAKFKELIHTGKGQPNPIVEIVSEAEAKAEGMKSRTIMQTLRLMLLHKKHSKALTAFQMVDRRSGREFGKN